MPLISAIKYIEVGLHKGLLSLFVVAAQICCVAFVTDASAQTGHQILVPISFETATTKIKTSACLEVTERAPQSLINSGESAMSATGQQFQSVLEAIRKKDKPALLQLSDPLLGRDPKRFEEQAKLYFAQFEKMKLIGVRSLYQLDGLVVLLADFDFEGRPLSSALVFAEHQDGSVFFLPYETDLVAYRLLEDWLFARWGPVNTKSPSYCPIDSKDQARYRLALAPSGQHPSYLYLSGAPINSPGPLSEAVSRVQSAVKAIDIAVSSDKMDDFYNLLPESVRTESRKAYNDANGEARARLKNSILLQQPFFVFDASPLLIAYTRTPSGTVQVMYFTADAQGTLLWTNAQRLTLADRVFKFGPLSDAAKQPKPFSNLALADSARAALRPNGSAQF